MKIAVSGLPQLTWIIIHCMCSPPRSSLRVFTIYQNAWLFLHVRQLFYVKNQEMVYHYHKTQIVLLTLSNIYSTSCHNGKRHCKVAIKGSQARSSAPHGSFRCIIYNLYMQLLVGVKHSLTRILNQLKGPICHIPKTLHTTYSHTQRFWTLSRGNKWAQRLRHSQADTIPYVSWHLPSWMLHSKNQCHQSFFWEEF